MANAHLAELDTLVIRGTVSWDDGVVGFFKKKRNPWKNHRHSQLFLQKYSSLWIKNQNDILEGNHTVFCQKNYFKE